MIESLGASLRYIGASRAGESSTIHNWFLWAASDTRHNIKPKNSTSCCPWEFPSQGHLVMVHIRLKLALFRKRAISKFISSFSLATTGMSKGVITYGNPHDTSEMENAASRNQGGDAERQKPEALPVLEQA
jgi:hypothetical protein